MSILTALPRRVRRGRAAIAAAALAIVLSAGWAPAPVQAAPTAATRIAGYSAAPGRVMSGKAITVQGQIQRLSGRAWVRSQTTAVTVYFDPDGVKPNRAVGSVRTNAAGQFKTAFKATVSGRWSVRFHGAASLRASGTAALHVQVVFPAPKTSASPITRWTCPGWAPIKGNASSHIYHLPGQRFYTRTTPEICFASEAAAQRAGFRRSKV